MNALRRHENCTRATHGVSIQQLGGFPSHPHPFPKRFPLLLRGSGWAASRSTLLRLIGRRLDCEEGSRYFCSCKSFATRPKQLRRCLARIGPHAGVPGG
jgi:hypothetical protein